MNGEVATPEGVSDCGTGLVVDREVAALVEGADHEEIDRGCEKLEHEAPTHQCRCAGVTVQPAGPLGEGESHQ